MKKFFLLSIVIIIITTGCSIKTSNLNEKEKCANYRKTMENMHNYANIKDDNNESKMVTKIFYSPKSDSCLYSTRLYSITNNKPGENGTIAEYELYDFFTNEKVLNEKGCDGEIHCGLSVQDAEKSFNNKLKKYE